MEALILSLIDKRDTFEIVRDKLAEILLVESAKQADLAAAAGKDPDLWRLRVFLERENPIEVAEDDGALRVPIVSIRFDGSNFDKSRSIIVQRQHTTVTYTLDCYGFGPAAETLDGHSPGDERAAFEAQRAARLVRNIIMSGQHVYLGMRGVVSERWISSMQEFQPQLENRQAQHVVGVRMTLEVRCNEFAPQVEPVELEGISITLKREGTGEVLLEAEYPTP